MAAIVSSLPLAGGKLRIPQCCQSLSQSLLLSGAGVAGPGLGWEQEMLPRLLCFLLANLHCFSLGHFPSPCCNCGYALPRPRGNMGLAGALRVTKGNSATTELHQHLILISLLS